MVNTRSVCRAVTWLVFCLAFGLNAVRGKPKQAGWPAQWRLPMGKQFTSYNLGVRTPDNLIKLADVELSKTNDPVTRATLSLQNGMAHYRSGNFADAARFLKDARTQVFNRDGAAYFEADSRFSLGQYKSALALVKRFSRRYPNSLWSPHASVLAARCLLHLKRPKKAAKRLRTYVLSMPDHPNPVQLRFLLARAYEESGEFRKAAYWYQLTAYQYPADKAAQKGQLEANRLKNTHRFKESLFTNAQRLELGENLRKRKFFEAALSHFKTVVSTTKKTDKQRWAAEYQMARTWFQQERFDQAAAAFEQLGKVAKGSRARSAYRWQSRAISALGDPDKSAKLFIRKAHKGPLKAKQLKRLTWIFMNAGQYKKAQSWFKQLLRKKRKTTLTDRFWGAWFEYRAGHYDASIAAFSKMGTARGRSGARGLYWAARSAANNGRLSLAKTLYEKAIKHRPLGYYAYQSRARLAELEMPEAKLSSKPFSVLNNRETITLKGDCAPSTPAIPCATGTLSTNTKPRLIAEYGYDPIAELRALTKRYGRGLPWLMSAYEWAVIGEFGFASRSLRLVTDELRAFRKADSRARKKWSFLPSYFVDYRAGENRTIWGMNDRRKPKKSRSRRRRFLSEKPWKKINRGLRRAHLGLGDPFYGRRLARRQDRPSGDPSDVANQKWRERFPLAFRALVIPAAEKYKVDPLLLWAFMTVESSYNSYAISRAGARGLMQVMPHTGALVAQGVGWTDFGTAKLHRPHVSVEMSAWYFRQLLDKFQGQLPLAIASYNAGPHRVKMWVAEKKNHPMDEFIEEIPFDEAREYTKKILKYYALYQQIYLGKRFDWVGQTLNANVRDNINY
ncbi:MAG: transglycosylase SLT domain-containing protein [Myxococcota bacterium]|nr:transglycosylase SLT domain-containing protein [Myxococcota bacterium]